jgi:hypothetical protein
LPLAGLLFVAGADERGSEEPAEEPSEGADGDNKPLVASEFAQTVVLFPDFPDRSESASCSVSHMHGLAEHRLNDL